MSLFRRFKNKRSERFYRFAKALTIPFAILVSGLLVWGGSTAAFSGTTDNADNSWDAGKVALTNNHAVALFSASNIVPGYSETHCITITSTATDDTIMKMYTSAVSSTGPDGAPLLSSHLDVEVLRGSGGTNIDGTPGGCTGFIPEAGQTTTPTFDGTLAAFGSKNSFENGVGETTLVDGGAQQYQITVSLPDDTPNSLQSTSAGVTFVWENRSQ